MNTLNLHQEADFVEHYANRDWTWYRGLVAECVRYGMPGQWLDLGAGLGFFVECANRYGIRCIGLEGSDWAVVEARRRYPGIDIRCHLLEDHLPFSDKSITTIMCHQVTEHLPPGVVECMLKECYRVLDRNGVIFLYSPSKHDKNQRAEKTHINLGTPSSQRALLVRTGYEIMAEPNSLRPLIRTVPFTIRLSRLLYRISKLEWLTTSANVIARKP